MGMVWQSPGVVVYRSTYITHTRLVGRRHIRLPHRTVRLQRARLSRLIITSDDSRSVTLAPGQAPSDVVRQKVRDHITKKLGPFPSDAPAAGALLASPSRGLARSAHSLGAMESIMTEDSSIGPGSLSQVHTPLLSSYDILT